MAVELRDYQAEALENIVEELSAGGRCQLHHACGTGKTLVAMRAAERLCPPAGLVVVLCPTLGLVAQTLRSWDGEHERTLAALAVASDETVSDRVGADELDRPVTVDVEEIVQWLTRKPTGSLRLIVGTQKSAGRIGDALIATGGAADLLIVDEAHHSAGSQDKQIALVHDDRRFPATRRLYQTATPRILLSAASQRRQEDLVTMDDPASFGPVAHTYPFSRAIAEGWLDDYQLVVIGVTRSEVLGPLRRLGARQGGSAGSGPTPHTAAVQVALGRAAAEYGLRRVIAFTPRIRDAAHFAHTLPSTLAAAGLTVALSLNSESISSLDGAKQRKDKLARLAIPPDSGWTVLANARLLTEGIDIPAVDGVVFTRPKGSAIEVVQAVGRSLRPHPEGRMTATILVPILLPDDPVARTGGGTDADVMASREFETLWQVLRALRAHDDVLATDLDRRRTELATGQRPALPDRIVIRLPDAFQSDAWLDSLTVRLVRAATSSWWEGLGAAKTFFAKHGHLRAPSRHMIGVVELADWLERQRGLRRAGLLSADRIGLLDELGMVWDPRAELFEALLNAARRYHERHGHLRVQVTYVDSEGYALGEALRNRRRRIDALTDSQRRSLRELDPDWEIDPRTDQTNALLAAARRYHESTGNLRVPVAYVDDEAYPLGDSLRTRRKRAKAGTLDADVLAALNALDGNWAKMDARAEQREALASAAQRYFDRFGHLRVPLTYRDDDGYRLGQAIDRRRTRARAGKLEPNDATILSAIDPDWLESPREGKFNALLTAARRYYAATGNLRVPAPYVDGDGYPLGSALKHRRGRAAAGTLGADELEALAALDPGWAAPRR